MGYTESFYVSDEKYPTYDHLRLIAKCNKRPLNGLIIKSISEYIDRVNGDVKLVADFQQQSEFLRTATKGKLIDLNEKLYSFSERVIGRIPHVDW